MRRVSSHDRTFEGGVHAGGEGDPFSRRAAGSSHLATLQQRSWSWGAQCAPLNPEKINDSRNLESTIDALQEDFRRQQDRSRHPPLQDDTKWAILLAMAPGDSAAHLKIISVRLDNCAMIKRNITKCIGPASPHEPVRMHVGHADRRGDEAYDDDDDDDDIDAIARTEGKGKADAGTRKINKGRLHGRGSSPGSAIGAKRRATEYQHDRRRRAGQQRGKRKGLLPQLTADISASSPNSLLASLGALSYCASLWTSH